MKERVQRLRAADDPRIALQEPTLAKALRDAVERGLTEPAGCFIAIDSDGGIEGLIAFSEVDSQGRAYVELLHAAWHDEPTRIVRELLDASLSQLPVRPATLEYLLDERRGRGHGLGASSAARRHKAHCVGASKLARVRRVAVTGLGAVTPLGNDAPSTWRAAIAGESGIDFIRSFDASEFPVRIAAEVKDFDPSGLVSPREARRLDRNVLLALAAAIEAKEDAKLNGFDPARVGIVFGSAIGGFQGIMDQHQVLQERGPDRVSPYFIPSVLVDSASGQLAISLGMRGPNYAPVSACATGAHAPPDPRRLLRDARPCGRGRVPAPRLAPLRRDARGIRHGGGRLRARPRGARGRSRAGSEGVCGGTRLRGLERRVSHGGARSGLGRSGGDDARCSRARARGPDRSRLRERPRNFDPAWRSCRDEGAQGGLRRACLPARGLLDEVDDGALLWSGRGDRGDDVRARDSRGRHPADAQLRASGPRMRPGLRTERGARGEGGRRALERDGARRPQWLRSLRAG